MVAAHTRPGRGQHWGRSGVVLSDGRRPPVVNFRSHQLRCADYAQAAPWQRYRETLSSGHSLPSAWLFLGACFWARLCCAWPPWLLHWVRPSLPVLGEAFSCPKGSPPPVLGLAISILASATSCAQVGHLSVLGAATSSCRRFCHLLYWEAAESST